MSNSIVALNITSNNIKFAQIANESGQRTVRMLSQIRPDHNGQGITSEAIQKYIHENHLKSLKTVLIISSHDLHYKDFTFPFDSRKKIIKAIQFEVQSEYPENDFLIDFIETIAKEPGKKSFLAALARKVLIRERLDQAKSAGLQIIGITSDLSTLGHYFKDKKEALVMEMGPKRSLFALYAHGVPLLFRDVPIGFEELKGHSGGLDRQHFKPLTGEIKRTIHSFRAKTGIRMKQIHVTGNMMDYPELRRMLREALDLDVLEESPPPIGLKADYSHLDLNRYASVLGAIEWKKKNRSFNFLQENLLDTKPVTLVAQLFRRLAILVGFFLLVLLISSWMKMGSLEERKAFLSSEIRKTFQTTFPQATRIVDEVKQARNYLNTQNTLTMEGSRTGEASLLDVIKTMSTTIPESTFFQITNLYYERGKMEISGKTDSFKTVNSIQELLSGARIFSNVTISNAKLSSEGQNVEFQISIRFER